MDYLLVAHIVPVIPAGGRGAVGFSCGCTIHVAYTPLIRLFYIFAYLAKKTLMHLGI